GAEPARDLELPRVARGREDRTGPPELRDLKGERRDAAADAVDQDRLAFAQSRARHQHAPGGEPRERKCGGLRRRKILGPRKDVLLRDDDRHGESPRKVLSEEPVVDAEALLSLPAELAFPARETRLDDDSLTALPGAHSLAAGVDRPAAVRSGNARERDRNARDAVPHEEV